MKNPLLFPQVLSMKIITLKGAFSINKPYFKLMSSTSQKVYYNTKHQGTVELEKADGHSFKLTDPHWFAGDVTLEIKEDKSIGKNLLISFMFNTAFVDTSQPLRVGIQEMSPLGKQKQDNFKANFGVEIEFRRVCECGEGDMHGCAGCHGSLKEQTERWDRIREALKVTPVSLSTVTCC